LPSLFLGIKLSVVAARRTKLPKDSRVFEQVNLDRLKRCSETLSRAEQTIREAKVQIEHSHELMRNFAAGKSKR
jgi:hypothetical protein